MNMRCQGHRQLGQTVPMAWLSGCVLLLSSDAARSIGSKSLPPLSSPLGPTQSLLFTLKNPLVSVPV